MIKTQWLTPVLILALICVGSFGIIFSSRTWNRKYEDMERVHYSIAATVVVVMEQILVSVWFAWLWSQKSFGRWMIRALFVLFFCSWLAFAIGLEGLITITCAAVSPSMSAGGFCGAVFRSSMSLIGYQGARWSILTLAFNLLWSFLVLIYTSCDCNSRN